MVIALYHIPSVFSKSLIIIINITGSWISVQMCAFDCQSQSTESSGYNEISITRRILKILLFK